MNARPNCCLSRPGMNVDADVDRVFHVFHSNLDVHPKANLCPTKFCMTFIFTDFE
jgi:hypothetical protein